MQKRTSWDQKNKHIHKSRKKIIDTVFGREDNTQRVFGYEVEGKNTKKEVGEIWTDSDGKTWEQKDGYKVSVSQFDDVRQYLEKLNTCSNENCQTNQYTHIDKKILRKTGMCLSCLQEFETALKLDGTFPFYEDYKLTRNKLAYAKDMKQRFEEAMKSVKKDFEMVSEDGSLQKWVWDIDLDKVKKDLETDIETMSEIIELLTKRKEDLEIELKNRNHEKLIFKF
jgi:tetratricopeptide (TPR) repeat protein